MKSFEELFNEAEKIYDRRTEVFNQLIEKTKTEILPKFCEICSNYDLEKVYFKTTNKVFDICEKQNDEYGFFYSFAIYVNSEKVLITDAEFNFITEKYSTTKNWRTIDELKIYKTGIIEFVKLLNSRLESYNKKYHEQNLIAEKI